MKTLYLDMDGVICDFEKRYMELFGEHPNDTRAKKALSDHWTKFIEGKNFANLDYWPTGLDLLDFVKTLEGKVNIEILSSSGGQEYHNEVQEQKLLWLKNHNIHYKANIVPGGTIKAEFARGADTILVDDTDYVIKSFIEAGGIGILHYDLGNTIKLIEEALVY